MADVDERKKKLQDERNNYDLMHGEYVNLKYPFLTPVPFTQLPPSIADVVLETSTRQTSRKLRERQGIKEVEPKMKRPKTTPMDILCL